MSGCDLETFRHAIYVHIFPVYFTAQVSYISLKLTNSKIKNHFTHTRTHLVTHTSTRLVCVCVCVLSVCVVKCKHLNQKRGPASQPASLKGRKGVSGIRGCTVCWRVWIPLTLCALFVQHVAHCPRASLHPAHFPHGHPPQTQTSRGAKVALLASVVKIIGGHIQMRKIKRNAPKLYLFSRQKFVGIRFTHAPATK